MIDPPKNRIGPSAEINYKITMTTSRSPLTCAFTSGQRAVVTVGTAGFEPHEPLTPSCTTSANRETTGKGATVHYRTERHDAELANTILPLSSRRQRQNGLSGTTQ